MSSTRLVVKDGVSEASARTDLHDVAVSGINFFPSLFCDASHFWFAGWLCGEGMVRYQFVVTDAYNTSTENIDVK